MLSICKVMYVGQFSDLCIIASSSYLSALRERVSSVSHSSDDSSGVIAKCYDFTIES